MHPGNADSPVPELERRIGELLALLQRLAEENRVLRHSQEQLASERAQLLSKNEQARSRVEAMITRLKGLEHSG